MKTPSRAVEVIIFLALAGILANLAVPVARSASMDSSAMAIVEETADIQEIVEAYESREGRYPAHGAWGRIPVELESDGKRLDFRNRHAELRWRNWGLLGGLDKPLRAVHVRSKHPKLLSAVMAAYEGRVILVRNDQIALVVD